MALVRAALLELLLLLPPLLLVLRELPLYGGGSGMVCVELGAAEPLLLVLAPVLGLLPLAG